MKLSLKDSPFLFSSAKFGKCFNHYVNEGKVFQLAWQLQWLKVLIVLSTFVRKIDKNENDLCLPERLNKPGLGLKVKRGLNTRED